MKKCLCFFLSFWSIQHRSSQHTPMFTQKLLISSVHTEQKGAKCEVEGFSSAYTLREPRTTWAFWGEAGKGSRCTFWCVMENRMLSGCWELLEEFFTKPKCQWRTIIWTMWPSPWRTAAADVQWTTCVPLEGGRRLSKEEGPSDPRGAPGVCVCVCGCT